MSSQTPEPLNRRIARKIAKQLDVAGHHAAAEYVRGDVIAVLINLVLRDAAIGKVDKRD